MKALVVIGILLVGVILAGCIGQAPNQGQSSQSMPTPEVKYNQTEVESVVNTTDINSTDELGEISEEMPF